MKFITDLNTKKTQRPIKIVQFGEGFFVRAFVDYFVDVLNEKTDFNGDIAIVKPRPGSLERFKKQNNLYTVLLRGIQDGETICEKRLITSVAETLDPLGEYDDFMRIAREIELRFVISNTTEAGITFDPNDHLDGLPNTYPGKLTKFLCERYQTFGGDKNKGLIILPLELIEDNGRILKECVLKYAKLWNLGSGFQKWIEEDNIFCSTLVDRIVTGFPKNEVPEIYETLGYEDPLLDVAEPFGLWVIESEKDISAELPFEKAGLPIIFTDNVTPYRERKVRIINGAHTGNVLVSYLGGASIVRDMMQHHVFGAMVRHLVDEEIVPYVPLERENVLRFTESVYERFENPFTDHEILAISRNSVAKWKVRLLPSFHDYYQANGKIPKWITFSFAGLLAFYHAADLREDGIHATRRDGTEYLISDNADVLKFFAEKTKLAVLDYVKAVAENQDFWGEDLTRYEGFVEAVIQNLTAILEDPENAVKNQLMR